MLSREKFEEIERALKSRTESSRSVARKFGISHTLANKIRRRPDRVRVADVSTVAEPIGEFCRCPSCGSKTKTPCVYCAVKNRLRSLADAFKNSAEQTAEEVDDEFVFLADPFELNLTPDEFERYREVRKWRESRADPRFDVVPSDWPWLVEETKEQRSPRTVFL